MPITFYVGRHGETADDILGKEKVTGWLPVPLNERGRKQAHSLGRFLRNRGITKIISSDTKRALQTAEIVASHIGCKVSTSPHFRSWNMGSIEGMYHGAAKPFLEFFQKNFEVAPPRGERFDRFFGRLKSAFWAAARFVKKFPDGKLLILTHSQDLELIKWFRDSLEPGDAFEFGDGIPPAGCAQVTISDDGKISIRKIHG